MDEKECKYKEIAHHTEECRLYNYNRGEGLNLSIDCNNNPNCMFKQLRTATEQLSIAKEALKSYKGVKMSSYYNQDDIKVIEIWQNRDCDNNNCDDCQRKCKASQTLKNQSISSDFVINNLQQQLRTATEQLRIAKEALDISKKIFIEQGHCPWANGVGEFDCENCNDDCMLPIITKALAKIEELKC